MKEKLTITIVRFIFSTALTIACLFPTASMAHNKVVVIPLGEDTKSLEPFAPLAAPAPPVSDYTVGQDAVIDNITGLEWQKVDGNITLSWDSALSHCQYSTIDDKRDWRLPSVSELVSIANYGTFNPAINGGAFPDTDLLGYWSASSVVVNSLFAWSVSFSSGAAQSWLKTTPYYVRCVRSNRPNGPLLQGNNNGSVTDLATGLTWQQQDDDIVKNWVDAQNYCSGLVLGNRSNWRLPNIKELASIVDYRLESPAIANDIFPSSHGTYYLSASSDASNSSDAWYIDFQDGDSITIPKTSPGYVRCVR